MFTAGVKRKTHATLITMSEKPLAWEIAEFILTLPKRMFLSVSSARAAPPSRLHAG
jgi:hypothetical protein